jgi:hypothetical protein
MKSSRLIKLILILLRMLKTALPLANFLILTLDRKVYFVLNEKLTQLWAEEHFEFDKKKLLK